MWQNYKVGQFRTIIVPIDLKVAIEEFCNLHGYQQTDVFDIAVRKFSKLWNAENIEGYEEAGDILIDNPPPKSKQYVPLHVRFSEKSAYEIACEAERFAFVRSTTDFVKRVLSWYLRKVGILEEIKPRRLIKIPRRE